MTPFLARNDAPNGLARVLQRQRATPGETTVGLERVGGSHVLVLRTSAAEGPTPDVATAPISLARRHTFKRCLTMSAHRRLLCCALAVIMPLWLAACATTVFPPQPVADPAQIGILDHGWTASLIMEIPDRGMLRYAYGDWNWYALGQTGPAEASSAMLWPSEAALGRMELPGPFSPTAVSREVRVSIEQALYLIVDARDVRRLVDRLDRIFDENRARSVYNEAPHLVFVPHPEPYSMFHNSNHMVAAWLEQLGCRLDGITLFSNWKLGTERSTNAATEGSASIVDRAVSAARSRGSDAPARGERAERHSLPAAVRAKDRSTASIRDPAELARRHRPSRSGHRDRQRRTRWRRLRPASRYSTDPRRRTRRGRSGWAGSRDRPDWPRR